MVGTTHEPSIFEHARHLAGARRRPPTGEFRPQLAVAATNPPSGDEWLHETKWDGYRLLAELHDGKAQLYTRNRLDWTERFPWLARALEALPVHDAWLDGELIAINAKGDSDFSVLQETLKQEATRSAGPLRYAVFDLPRLGELDLSEARLDERKALLGELLRGSDPALVYSTHIVGHGWEVYRAATRRGLEGIMSKRAGSAYRAGRGDGWQKVKHVLSDEFVIVGHTAPRGARAGFGALLLATRDPHGWRYVGRVGTGFDDATLRSLSARLQQLQSTQATLDLPKSAAVPSRSVNWVRPELVVEVAYRGWGALGLLRQPSFMRLRDDKSPNELGSPPFAESPISANHVTLTHPDRVVYPASKESGARALTKQEVAEYYRAVARWMLPELVRRPLSLVRCPQGISGTCFFQKHHLASLGAHVAAVTVPEKAERVDYLYVHDLDGLLELVQMNALEFHPWGARVDAPERPDRLVFDLDPAPEVGWGRTVEAAREVRDRLVDAGLRSYVRTTGGKGLHVVVPFERGPSWQQAKDFCGAFAKTMAKLRPDRYIATANKARRKGLIFIDWLRNGRGATSIASWSLRTRPGAPVAMPLAWDELDRISSGDAFTLRTAKQRAEHLQRSPWPDLYATEQRLPR